MVNCTLYREADAHLANLSPPPGTQDSSSSPSSGTHDGSFGRLDGTVCALQYVHTYDGTFVEVISYYYGILSIKWEMKTNFFITCAMIVEHILIDASAGVAAAHRE